MEPSFEQPRGVLPPYVASSVVVGRFGLRAGWSMAIFVVLLFVITAGMSFARHAIMGGTKLVKEHQAQIAAQTQEVTPRWAATGEAVGFTAAALATLSMALLERRRMAVYGIDRPTIYNFLPGAFWGLVSLSLLVFTLRAGHMLVFDRLALSGPAIYLYGGKWMAEPAFPEGMETNGLLGLSSNQQFMGLPVDATAKPDDHAFLRPTQSEAVLQQFGSIAVFSAGRITGRWPALPMA